MIPPGSGRSSGSMRGYCFTDFIGLVLLAILFFLSFIGYSFLIYFGFHLFYLYFKSILELQRFIIPECESQIM